MSLLNTTKALIESECPVVKLVSKVDNVLSGFQSLTVTSEDDVINLWSLKCLIWVISPVCGLRYCLIGLVPEVARSKILIVKPLSALTNLVSAAYSEPSDAPLMKVPSERTASFKIAGLCALAIGWLGTSKAS